MTKLAIILSHPVQYYSPLFVAATKEMEVRVFYGFQPNSEQQGREGFGKSFDWDVDLLLGYEYEFLENVARSPSSSNYKGCDTPNIGERLKKYGVTHIVSFGWHLKMYRQALDYAKRNKISIAVRGDSQLNPLLPWWKKVIKRIYYPFFLKKYDAFLSVGQRNRAYLNYYGVDDQNIIFSPHAIDQAFWRGQEKKESLSFVFVWVAKFIQKKRPLDVIKAFKISFANIPNVALNMVGTGELLKESQELASGINNINFLGFKNQSELKKEYLKSDCLILSSDYGETWGLVVNEAFATGLPAIVSDAAGCSPDLILNHSGLTYSMGNIEELNQRMIDIQNWDQLEISNSIKSLNKVYSFKTNVDAFKELLIKTNLLESI
jgi:glycosyltransferase involved in cell wall biosynthesis